MPNPIGEAAGQLSVYWQAIATILSSSVVAAFVSGWIARRTVKTENLRQRRLNAYWEFSSAFVPARDAVEKVCLDLVDHMTLQGTGYGALGLGSDQTERTRLQGVQRERVQALQAAVWKLKLVEEDPLLKEAERLGLSVLQEDDEGGPAKDRTLVIDRTNLLIRRFDALVRKVRGHHRFHE